MTKARYYRTPHGNALKAVIGPRGEKVPRNFNPKKVHLGDITLAMHLNTNKVTGDMTPAQRESVIELIREMSNDLLRQMGVETDLGFKPGTIVTVKPQNFHYDNYTILACVIDDNNGEMLLWIYEGGAGFIKARRSTSNYDIEELATSNAGLKGLLIELMSEYGKDDVVYSLKNTTIPIETQKELIEYAFEIDRPYTVARLIEDIDDEEYLKGIIAKCEDDKRMRLDKEWLYGDAVATALKNINDQAFLQEYFKSNIFLPRLGKDYNEHDHKYVPSIKEEYRQIALCVLPYITEIQTLIFILQTGWREEDRRDSYRPLIDGLNVTSAVFNRLVELRKIDFVWSVIDSKFSVGGTWDVNNDNIYYAADKAMKELERL